MTDKYQPFPKIPRLTKDMVVTEKLDGTNAQVVVLPDGTVKAGSRKRWITPEDDNYGFARWVEENKEQLKCLGPGSHFGEWWGRGIQRGYGLDERRFSLFNVGRWNDVTPPPPCCHVVPVLDRFTFSTERVTEIVEELAFTGSKAAPGFMKPEGVIVFHSASGQLYKRLIESDEGHKWQEGM